MLFIEDKDMSELKATPGPWVALKCNSRYQTGAMPPLFEDGRWAVYKYDEANRIPIAEVDMGDDYHEPTRHSTRHDAHLIAAAPDMYQELLEIRDWMGSYNVTGKYDAEIDRIDNVLSKARGEDIQ